VVVTNAGNVGIGTTSPNDKLTVVGIISNKYAVTGNSSGLVLEPIALGGEIKFKTSDNSSRAKILGEDAGGGPGLLSFYVNSAGASLIERMRITSAGNVGIGTTSPASKLDVVGSLSLPYVAKTADYTATISDYTIAVTCSSVNITITLPTAVGITGRIYNIKKMDSTAYTVIVDGTGSETIDGTTTKNLTTQYDSIQIQSTGSAWIIT